MLLEPQTRFLGLAVGNNDAHSPGWMVDGCHKNFEQWLRQILDTGRVPILARIAETKDDPDG